MAKKTTYSSWAFLISTFFGVGRIPFFPGTIGSLMAFPLYFILVFILIFGFNLNITAGTMNVVIIIISILLFILGCYSCNLYSKQISQDDPSEIIFDEVVAQLLLLSLTLLTVPYLRETPLLIQKFSLNIMDFYNILLFSSCAIFRIFDIV